MEVLSDDLIHAVQNVLESIVGITELYPVQIELLSSLVNGDNVFMTSATNSGKTLPAVLFSSVLDELNKMGYSLPSGKVIFVTALNSIKLSMLAGMKTLGIVCEAITLENFSDVLESETKVIFIRENFNIKKLYIRVTFRNWYIREKGFPNN